MFNNRACLRQNPQQNPQRQSNNTGPYGGGSKPSTGQYGGADVKPKVPANNPYGAPRQANNPYGAPKQQASNPYSGAACCLASWFFCCWGGGYSQPHFFFLLTEHSKWTRSVETGRSRDFFYQRCCPRLFLRAIMYALFCVRVTVGHQVAAAGGHGAAGRATPTPTEAAGARTAARCRGRARTACTFPSLPSTLTRTAGQSRPGEDEKDTECARVVENCHNALGIPFQR